MLVPWPVINLFINLVHFRTEVYFFLHNSYLGAKRGREEPEEVAGGMRVGVGETGPRAQTGMPAEEQGGGQVLVRK